MFEDLEYVGVSESRPVGWYVYWRDPLAGLVSTHFESQEDAMQFIEDLKGENHGQ